MRAPAPFVAVLFMKLLLMIAVSVPLTYTPAPFLALLPMNLVSLSIRVLLPII